MGSNFKRNEERFGVTVAAAYPTKNGFWTLKIRGQEYDALQRVQIGGKLTLNVIPEETRAKNPKLPPAFIKYLTPEQVEEQDAYFNSKRGSTQKTPQNDDI